MAQFAADPQADQVTTTVAVVDDHLVVAEGFARLVANDPRFRVTAVLGSGEELLNMLATSPPPDVLALDLAMPGLNGADLLRTLRAEHPGVRILVVSAAARPEIAARCLREGALGFLSKFRSSESFLDALSAVADRRRYIDADLLSETLALLATNPTGGRTFEDLSAREFTVMQRIAEGKSIKEIATAMNVNAKTVSTYRARVLKKLGLRSNAELTAYCLRRQLVTIDDS